MTFRQIWRSVGVCRALSKSHDVGKTGATVCTDTSNINFRRSLPCLLPSGMFNIQRLTVCEQFSRSSFGAGATGFGLVMVDLAALNHSHSSPVKDFTVVCNSSGDACSSFMGGRGITFSTQGHFGFFPP